MATVALPSRRSTLQEGPSGLEISIPTKKNWFVLIFLLAWLGGWAMGEISAIGELLGGSDTEESWFLAFWLVGWTVGGGFVIYVLFWMLAGIERVVLGADSLLLRKEVFGVGRGKKYSLGHVSNLRIVPPSDLWSSGMRFWGVGGGLVAFDYGAKTLRFGSGLDEAEASMIVQDLTARHGTWDTVDGQQ